MTPRLGFRTDKTADSKSDPTGAWSAAAITASATPGKASRAADYAYRIAALTAGLILLATVM
ncbi:MAG TPA: hypothetical protein VK593_09220 [Edaphobacter sp.]|nr:hypothetical protein [Edaphobacter sp.]